MHSTEREYQAKLKVLKHHYDQRIQLLNEKVAQIYQELSEDEVIATMKDDPTSNEYTPFRLKEICENNLAMEREETIGRLMSELAESQSSSERLAVELSAAHEFIEKAEGLLNVRLSNETAELAGRFSNMLTELQHNISTLSRDNEVAKLKLHDHFEIITEKSQENEHLNKETKELRKEIDHLACEKTRLNTDLIELTRQNQAAEENTEALERDSNAQCARLNAENRKLKEEALRTAKETQENGRKQEFENKKRAERIEHEYKAKSTRLKKKIIELKNRAGSLNKDLSLKAKVIENAQTHYEWTIEDLTSDLSKAKGLWEQKFREAAEQHSIQLAKASDSHRQQLDELKEHYQGVLHSKAAELDNENQSRVQEAEQRTIEKYENKLENEYILNSVHSQRLAGELTKLKSTHFGEIRELEEQHSTELSRKTKEIRQTASEELANTENKQRKAEENCLQLTAGKRETEYKLELASQQLEGAHSRLAATREELEESQASQRTLHKLLEENQNETRKLKTLSQQEQLKNSRLESDSESLNRKCRDLDESLQKSHSQAISQKKELEEKLLNNELTINKLEKSFSALENDSKSLADSKRTTEAEKQELVKSNAQESRVLENSLKRARKEAAEQSDRAAQEHLQVKQQLLEAENTAKLRDESISELQRLLSTYEGELATLQMQLSKSQDLNRNSESELRILKSRFTEENRALFTKRLSTKNRISSVLGSIQSDFRFIQQESYDELKQFRKSFASELLNASHILQQKLHRNRLDQDTRNFESSQEILSLNRKLKESQDFSVQDYYEKEAEELRSTVKFLQGEVNRKNEEITQLARKTDEYQLERSFIENDKSKVEKDLNDIIATLETKEQNSQQEFNDKLQKSKEKLRKKQKEELSEQLLQVEQLKAHTLESLTFFSDKIVELQAFHEEETRSLAAHFEGNLVTAQQEARASSGHLREQDSQIRHLQSSLQGLECKTSDVLARIEADLLEFQDSLALDKERATKFKLNATAEIDSLRSENKRIRSAVEGQNDVIERLEDDKELLRKEIRLQRNWLGAREFEGPHQGLTPTRRLSISHLQSRDSN